MRWLRGVVWLMPMLWGPVVRRRLIRGQLIRGWVIRRPLVHGRLIHGRVIPRARRERPRVGPAVTAVADSDVHVRWRRRCLERQWYVERPVASTVPGMPVPVCLSPQYGRRGRRRR